MALTRQQAISETKRRSSFQSGDLPGTVYAVQTLGGYRVDSFFPVSPYGEVIVVRGGKQLGIYKPD